jgi:DNA-binding Lrp family transcriptional regulator
VLQELKKVEGVEDAHTLWGVYDIIVSIKADTIDKLKSIITKRIEKVARVDSKLTLLTSDITAARMTARSKD